MNVRRLADLANRAERKLMCLKIVRAAGTGVEKTNGILCEQKFGECADSHLCSM